ncbi:hypothetical protein NBE99_09340 [Thermosynechococcus sp. HN-54]|uniref:hypothetical protein n=1 Tax=Thermosynechococcus sp. HN-54 TaxID=2933959 RepID=UPI00202CF169|nr:hypothetical protein [Thermosynechococcus sp. HN-54]URR34842.1 hypothetical protein NBE99_09340 [Thermosynechococcus sp. HN-54]
MKVLEQTDYRLRLQERPLALWLFGGLFCLVPVLILSVFPVADIECQRQTFPYECVVTTTSFVTQERVKIPLSVLRQAKLEDYIDSEGDRMYRIVLEGVADSIPLGIASSDAGDRATIVEQINQFLANPNQMQLSARVDDRWLIQIVVGVFFLVGASLIALTPVLTLDLDRSSGTLTIFHANFFRRTHKELRLREISDITIESSVDSEGDRLYRVVVHLASGEKVPLRHYYSSGYNSKKELANHLRQFLYLPPYD